MKKLLSILSLGALLFSSLAPSFTYAVDINEVSSLLESFLQSTNNEQQENNENIFQQSSNPELQNIEDEAWEDEIEIIWGNNHIIHNITKWTITIYTWNYSYWITLQDRDLWAEGVGEIWLYYQWWNNHWKTEWQELLETLIERWDYDWRWYDWNITWFINRVNENNDYWEIEDPNNIKGSLHNNLWWWWNDDQNNNFWYDETTHKATNISERKWPCPEWYHVPSLWERSKLVYLYFNWIKKPEFLTEDNDHNWIYYTTSSDWANRFINTFKINLWWQIHIQNWENLNNTLVSSKYYSYLWTSTPRPLNDQYNNLVFNVWISNDFVYTNRSYNRSVWLQVRCFKNEYIPYSKKVIFNPNWWAFSWMDVNVIKNYEYQTNENWIIPIYNIQIPDRESEDISQQSWWMFAWWYTKSWDNDDWWEEFDISNPNSTIAYAKWLPFNELILNFWWQEFTIMDRNLWAEDVAEWKYYWNDNHEDNTKLWYYYQWWNNYWFKNNATPVYSWFELIENNSTEQRWPWNYYYNNKYIKRSNEPYRWDKENNFNLRWWDNQKNADSERKGPCPQWYHVPDINERNSVINMMNKEIMDNPNYCVWEYANIDKCFSNKLKAPYAGEIHESIRKINNQWKNWRYRSSTRWDNTDYWINYGAFAITIYNGDWVYNLHTYRTSSFPIRCFKNTSPINTLTIEKDNWEDDIVYPLRWWEVITSDYKPDDPVKKWYKFLWWYSWDNKFTFNWYRFDDSATIKAKWEKRPWYTYDTNWWVFADWTKENIIKFDETEFERKVSHTPNVNDDWVQNWSYPADLNSIDVLTIEWADVLELNIKGKTKCENGSCDYIAIWKWNHPTYDASNYSQYENDFLWILSSYSKNMEYRFWQEDSFTIWFYSSGNKAGRNNFWYFAELIWLKYTTEESIATPERKWYSFSWWYESWALEPFDFTWTKINQDRTFYAKWNPNTYTIHFNNNWWTWVVADINATYWEEITLPTISKEGYRFKWWKSEDWIIYNNIIPEWTWVTTEDWVTVTLTAQWELIPVITPSAWWGQSITPAKQETKITEQEHNSADTEKATEKTTEQDNTKTTSTQTTSTPTINEQVKKVEWKSLTRWEIAVMTNILLEVYPQLTENKSLNKVSEACENFADEQNFTNDEKKAITRLCRLSIMWIHNDTNEPLEEFLVNNKSTNAEFSKVINRSLSTYTEKDFSVVKDALKKLEWDEENVVFGTVYEVFMSIKNIFN